MKIKIDFITNSSSTAFLITNFSEEAKTLVDFVKENPQLIENFRRQYDYKEADGYTQAQLITSALENNIDFKGLETKFCIFGDESGTLVGHVFDYILRDGGRSKNFKWRFDEYLR